MAVNKYKGEMALPEIGKGYLIAFTLDDLAALEDEFGRQFFAEMEKACIVDFSVPTIIKILSIALRKRNAKGEVEKVGEEFDFHALHQRDDFNFRDVCPQIMDSISLSLLGRTHKELVEEALEAQKKQQAEELKRLKEVADEADLPFSEALSDGLSNLLIDMESRKTSSGD